MTISRRERRWRVTLVIALLIAAHFYVRPWLGSRVAPDLLLLAMMLVAIRSRPGTAAVVGFLIGLTTDVLTPARFGAGALAHTVVGYLAAWGRAVFFPDNLIVNAGLFAAGVWARNLIVLLASGAAPGEMMSSLLLWSTLQAITTALVGVVVVVMFRNWLAIRLDE
ncbi:MAG: rod shape-determining protein MreD [Gemmatimonadales bacterium]|nr:rod shape-determining protein MreD [Gemmatimonadota bacterium]MDX2058216.1 rod shape-determining protein MreD [Gemmatimonadales bacterium]